jgi:hypothetical protein
MTRWYAGENSAASDRLVLTALQSPVPRGSQSSRRYSPHGLHIPRGSTSLRARSPHGAAVLMGAMSLGPRPPYALNSGKEMLVRQVLAIP